MFSGQFYENRLSAGEETVTYIAVKERVTCVITTETVMCIMHCRKSHLHNCNKDSHLGGGPTIQRIAMCLKSFEISIMDFLVRIHKVNFCMKYLTFHTNRNKSFS